MKTLLVLDSLSFGGAERLLLEFVRKAPTAGIDVDIATIAGPIPESRRLLPAFRDAGADVRFLHIPRVAYPPALWRLSRAIRAAKADVVHAHLVTACTFTPPAATLARRPSVCTFHHVPDELTGRDAARERLAVESAGRSEAMLLVSEAARRAFASRYIPRPSWRVLHNGVDLDRFSPGPGPLPGDLAVPSGAPVVVLVAAMRGFKGHDTAIRAWRTVRRSQPDARLVMVGSGQEEQMLQGLAEREGVADRVIFAGHRNDVDTILRGASLAILPSATEALPTTLIEAAGAGLPAVASRVGGVPEVVEDGVTGVLVPPADVGVLAAAITRLLADDELRARMGADARALALRRFAFDAWLGRLRGIYDEAVARRRREVRR